MRCNRDRFFRSVVVASLISLIPVFIFIYTSLHKPTPHTKQYKVGNHILVLPEKWRERFEHLKKRSPVKIRLEKAWIRPTWFGFFTVKDAFDNCALPCQSYVEQNITDYDVVVYHTSECRGSAKHEFDQIDTWEQLNTPSRYTTIHANLRIEPDFIDSKECNEELRGPTEFEFSPVDMTLGFHKNSTIVANYFYSKPESFVFTPHDDSDMFQGMCAFISNCVKHRVDFMKELMEYIPLRSYGSCLNNQPTEWFGWKGERFKLKKIRNCKFYLAFENAHVEDYVTEKYYQGWKLNSPTIVVYSGAPNVLDVSPTPKGIPSFIDAGQFSSVKELGLYMQSLLNDKSKFDAYFEWRKTGDPHKDYSPEFMKHYESRVINVPCKICVAGAEMQLARQILAEQGYEPAQGKYKLSRQAFEQTVSGPDVEALRQLYDIAYGRYWRQDNYNYAWNDLSYSISSNWVEFPNIFGTSESYFNVFLYWFEWSVIGIVSFVMLCMLLLWICIVRIQRWRKQQFFKHPDDVIERQRMLSSTSD